jgi:hypothetical protein
VEIEHRVAALRRFVVSGWQVYRQVPVVGKELTVELRMEAEPRMDGLGRAKV